MRSLRPSLLVFALAIVVGLIGPASAGQFGAETFTLTNGLQVVVVQNHRSPVVTQMVWYKVGAADEPVGTSGIAHFLEHLMFRGTKETPPGAFSRIVSQNGGRDNAFTTSDYTAYFQNVASDRLELMMKLEAERMVGLQLTDAVVTPERQVIIEERRSRIDNNPSSLLSEQVDTAIYLHHPYRIPVIGWEHEMQKLSTQDAQTFYTKWYAPNNAVLIVVGDVTLETVRQFAEKYYGPIPSRPVPERHRISEPPKVASVRLELKSPRAGSASWTRYWLAPSYNSGDKRTAYALQVLSNALGGGATSRLYKALVVEKGLALNAGSFYSANSVDVTTFGFYATPKPGVAIPDLESAIEVEVKKLLKDGLTAEEVDRGKKRMQSAAIYSRDSLSGPARIIGEGLATGRSLDEIEAWPDRIGAVTVEEVNAAAKLVIKENISVTGVLLPEPTS